MLHHISPLVKIFSFECNLWIANVSLALNQTNLQTTWLGIISRTSIVIQCPLQKCLQGWETLQQSIYNCAVMRIQSQMVTTSHSLIISKVMVPLLMSSFLLLLCRQKHAKVSLHIPNLKFPERPFKDWFW